MPLDKKDSRNHICRMLVPMWFKGPIQEQPSQHAPSREPQGLGAATGDPPAPCAPVGPPVVRGQIEGRWRIRKPRKGFLLEIS